MPAAPPAPSFPSCGRDCACPTRLHHAAHAALGRYNAPIPVPSVSELASWFANELVEHADDAEALGVPEHPLAVALGSVLFDARQHNSAEQMAAAIERALLLEG